MKRLARLPIVLAGAALVVALPARGDVGGGATPSLLTPPVELALTSIDSLPSIPTITTAYNTVQQATANLGKIATTATTDPGVRIRALRTMASYCPCRDTTVHDTAIGIINAYQSAVQASTPTTPTDLIVMRAAVETLGAANVVQDADVAVLTAMLSNPSRDIRATLVKTLRTSCSADALTAIQTLQRTEQSKQVLGELSIAQQTLSACVNK